MTTGLLVSRSPEVCTHVVCSDDMDDNGLAGLEVEGLPQQPIVHSLEGAEVDQGLVIDLQDEVFPP